MDRKLTPHRSQSPQKLASANPRVMRFPSTDPSLLSRQAGMGIVLGFRLATFR